MVRKTGVRSRGKKRTAARHIGILTGGGDCPGLNAVIRAVVKTATGKYGIKVTGFEDGYLGLIVKRYRTLSYDDASGILTHGGTILGTSNVANPFSHPVRYKGKTTRKDVSDRAIRLLRKLEIDGLICIGGDGTLSIAHGLWEKGAPVVGIPKTIDNDLEGTDITFGFDSALLTATEAIDKLHTTAHAHHRVMVIEVMGRYAGWLALQSGLAGGGDVVLIPEIPFRMESVLDSLKERGLKGRRFSIVVVAEGAKPLGGNTVVRRMVKDSPDPVRLGGIGAVVAREIEEKTGLETRVTVLGHLQRGGVPTPFDRILATRFGVQAVNAAVEGDLGTMVSLRGRKIVRIPLAEAISELRHVDPDGELVACARSIGICFGD